MFFEWLMPLTFLLELPHFSNPWTSVSEVYEAIEYKSSTGSFYTNHLMVLHDPITLEIFDFLYKLNGKTALFVYTVVVEIIFSVLTL